jgi:hypothetical protein
MAYGCQSKHSETDYWLLVQDTLATGDFGYINQQGDTVIPMGKYIMCFTDTFKTYAIVSKAGEGLVAIDRNEHVKFNVFPFDNGPDYMSEGLFRIVENEKIGYADEAGNVVIKPAYECAYPFENGKAQVAINCRTTSDGEHSTWESNQWLEIDKQGRIIRKQKEK